MDVDNDGSLCRGTDVDSLEGLWNGEHRPVDLDYGWSVDNLGWDDAGSGSTVHKEPDSLWNIGGTVDATGTV